MGKEETPEERIPGAALLGSAPARSRFREGVANRNRYVGEFLVVTAALYIERIRRSLKQSAPKIADTLMAGLADTSNPATEPPPAVAPITAGAPASSGLPGKTATDIAFAAIVEVKRRIRPELAPGGFTTMLPKLTITILWLGILAAAGWFAYSYFDSQNTPQRFR